MILIKLCYYHFMLNDLWLKTFTVLVEKKHFTKTAEFLNMTQPGVSQHIKKLENSLGFSLLLRDGKSFELTREGELLYNFSLKRQEDELSLMDVLSLEREDEGKIRIACSGTLAMLLFPQFLERQKKYPGLNICLEAAPDYLIEKKVLSNEVDIGITTSNMTNGSISHEEIGKEELLIVYNPECFDIAGKSIDELYEIGFVNHPDGRAYLDSLLQLNFPNKYDLNKISSHVYVNQINQILTPVSMGIGFTVMPKSFVQNFSKTLKLSTYSYKKPAFDKYYLIRNKNKVLGKRYDWFLREICDFMK